MAALGAVVLLTFIGILVSGDQPLSADGAGAPGSRIVSGWVARDGQFPYMLYIRGVTVHGSVTACAGAIIHNNWGVSSGSCTAQRTVLMIRAGMVDINRPRVTFETSSYFTAPEYIDEMHQLSQPHDISLIRFNRLLAYNDFIQPIRLMRSADMNRNYDGVRMTTSGWGTTWTNGAVTDVLNWVHLVGVTNFVCMLAMNSNFLVRESTICAGPYNVTSQGICAGDSGVPLTVVDTDGRLTLVGVGSFVSWLGCHVGLPSAFVRPGHYHNWIRSVTGINFDWSRAATVKYNDVKLPSDSKLINTLKTLKLPTV